MNDIIHSKTYAKVFAKDVMDMSGKKYKHKWGKLDMQVDDNEPEVESAAAAPADGPQSVTTLKDISGQLQRRGYVVNTRLRRKKQTTVWVLTQLNASGNFALITSVDDATVTRKVGFEVLCTDYSIDKTKLQQSVSNWADRSPCHHVLSQIESTKGLIQHAVFFLQNDFEKYHHLNLDILLGPDGVRSKIDYDVGMLTLIPSNPRVSHRKMTEPCPKGAEDFGDLLDDVQFHINPYKRASAEDGVICPFWYVGQSTTANPNHNLEFELLHVAIEYSSDNRTPFMDEIAVPVMRNVRKINAGDMLILEGESVAIAHAMSEAVAAAASSETATGVAAASSETATGVAAAAAPTAKAKAKPSPKAACVKRKANNKRQRTE